MTIFVVAKDGTPLMPTTNIKKVRKRLKTGKAKIIGHHPFTVQLLYDSEHGTQPIELCMDTGYQYIGVSLKSEKHEYVDAEYELLTDEKKRHDNCRKYRRARRNRLRYRKPRFLNRKKEKGWLAPSLKNKADRHVDLIARYKKVCPITSITLEVATFDTHVLEAMEEGRAIPKGEGYQKGLRYGFDTLREAVFERDKHTCVVCKASGIGKGSVPLAVHHLGFRKHDHSDRMANLATVCVNCHTSANHKPGGKLYEFKFKAKGFSGAAFMNTVRWYIYQQAKARFGDIVHMTYGVVTKWRRHQLNIEKSHANDAYCMGSFRPKHRTPCQKYKKRRRNNRILEKFYDAKVVDARTGEVKKGAELGCERTNRREARNSEKSLRKFRGTKVSKGRRSIRKTHYTIQPGDLLNYGGELYRACGVHNNGSRVMAATAEGEKSIAISKVTVLAHVGGWTPVAI